MRQYLRIGKIVRTHGVRGNVKVMPATDDLKRFKSLEQAYVEFHDSYVPVSVEQADFLPDGGIALHFKDIDTVEKAKGYVGSFICVDREHAVVLPNDSYFICDLIGCDVFDTNNVYYGKITDVYSGIANDVYVVDNGKLLIPALKRVINTIDTNNRKAVFEAEVLQEVGLFED